MWVTKQCYACGGRGFTGRSPSLLPKNRKRVPRQRDLRILILMFPIKKCRLCRGQRRVKVWIGISTQEQLRRAQDEVSRLKALCNE